MMKIGELAEHTGTSTRLLRHYENEGVLIAHRSSSGHRLFDAAAVERVRFIRELLGAGLPLRIIRELVDCIHEPGRVEPCAVPVLLDHLADHDARIAALQSTRESLKGLIDSSV